MTSLQPQQANGPVYDAAIIGGGLAGSLTAALLTRSGCNVVLIDLHASYPPDFRAEQVVGEQVAQLERLGLRAALLGNVTPISRAVVGAGGRLLGQVDAPHYGVKYDCLVARARKLIAPSVPVTVGRVVDVKTSLGSQEVVLADGQRIPARLVILAGGLQLSLLRKLGFTHRVIRDAHSMTFGFDVASLEPDGFPYPLSVYRGSGGQGIDYLTMFPLDGITRANLFTFRNVREPWAKGLRQTPEPMLREIMPGLERVFGRFRVTSEVATRVVDLYAVSDPVRDGLVLIGDAFQTSCPAAGTGISRLLTDIECLCETYMPAWLASHGMAAEKIASFYADPRKRAADAEAENAAQYRRAMTSGQSMGWRMHRAQLHLRQRIGGWVGGPDRLTTGVRPLEGMFKSVVAKSADQFTPVSPASNQFVSG